MDIEQNSKNSLNQEFNSNSRNVPRTMQQVNWKYSQNYNKKRKEAKLMVTGKSLAKNQVEMWTQFMALLLSAYFVAQNGTICGTLTLQHVLVVSTVLCKSTCLITTISAGQSSGQGSLHSKSHQKQTKLPWNWTQWARNQIKCIFIFKYSEIATHTDCEKQIKHLQNYIFIIFIVIPLQGYEEVSGGGGNNGGVRGHPLPSALHKK